MKKISIKPVWSIQTEDNTTLPPRLIELLVQVHAQGSLLAACQQLGLSYRHAWDLVRQGEALFQTALLHMERGKGSTLSALGEKLVWADRRISARLGPVLDSLASELVAEISRVVTQATPPLRIQASHGFAIEYLFEQLTQRGRVFERRYGSSVEAAAALHDGSCDLAGFHIPLGPLQGPVLAHYLRWLDRDDLVVIDVATRRLGLMLPLGNPKKVYDLADLTRPDVRFINRQAGSGTRLLLEAMLNQQSLQRQRISGFEQGEFTHAAVSAFVASGMADVGFGLEAPARQFHLDFIPLASERYFLMCHEAALAKPALQAVLEVLRDPSSRAAIDALPGYHGGDAGRITPLRDAFGPLGDLAPTPWMRGTIDP